MATESERVLRISMTVNFSNMGNYSESFTKNASKYGEKIIFVSGLTVDQIFEKTDFWGYNRTFCLAYDSNFNIFYTNLLGYAEDIYV